jgi:hypothetical protein
VGECSNFLHGRDLIDALSLGTALAVPGRMKSTHEMNPRNGFAFLAVGFFMWLLPALTPGLFPTPYYGGANSQALWLEGMGVIQLLLGGGLVIRHFLLPAATRWMAARRTAQAAPEFALSKFRGGARL